MSYLADFNTAWDRAFAASELAHERAQDRQVVLDMRIDRFLEEEARAIVDPKHENYGDFLQYIEGHTDKIGPAFVAALKGDAESAMRVLRNLFSDWQEHIVEDLSYREWARAQL